MNANKSKLVIALRFSLAVWLAAAGMLCGCAPEPSKPKAQSVTNSAKMPPPLPKAATLVKPAKMQVSAVFASLPPTRAWWLTWPDVWPVTPSVWVDGSNRPLASVWVPTAYLISCRSNLHAPWVELASTGTNWYRIGAASQPEQYYKVEPIQ